MRAHRACVRAGLDEIARQAKQVLAEQKIGLDLFFLTPNSGESVLMFGSPTDVDDPTWERISDIVSSGLRQVIGLEGTRCRPVMCSTTTDAGAGNEHSLMPILTPTASPAGADR